MKPEYANSFGIRKVSGKDGEVLEVTLDIAYKYMENAVTVTAKGGLENVSTPASRSVSSSSAPSGPIFPACTTRTPARASASASR